MTKPDPEKEESFLSKWTKIIEGQGAKSTEGHAPMTNNARDETLAGRFERIVDDRRYSDEAIGIAVRSNWRDAILAALRAAPPAPDTGMRQALAGRFAALAAHDNYDRGITGLSIDLTRAEALAAYAALSRQPHVADTREGEQ